MWSAWSGSGVPLPNVLLGVFLGAHIYVGYKI